MPRPKLSAVTEAVSAPPAKFQAIRSARAFEDIAAQIRTELAEGRLTVGSRLPAERTLAAQFGVSRNTLREALRSLEHAGLIQLQKGATGGAFISERSGEAIVTGLLDMYHMGAIQPAQLTQARIWLESIIVREACARATNEDIEALYRNIEAAELANAQGDFDLRSETHIDFHRILARMTGNPIMVIVMNGLLDVLRHFVRSVGNYDNTYVIPSRRRFMKHMEEGDTAAAVAEMEGSLMRLQQHYLSRVEAAATAAAAAATASAAPAPALPAARKRRTATAKTARP